MPAVFSILAVLILLFILFPLFKMVFLSDKEALWQSLLDPATIKSILLTIYSALIATAVGFILGVPLAYILARYDFPLRGTIEGLIDLPIVVPHSAAGIAFPRLYPGPGRTAYIQRKPPPPSTSSRM